MTQSAPGGSPLFASWIAVIAGGCLLLAGPLPYATAQTVHEVTIATPNVIAVEIRDPEFRPGQIRKLDTPSQADAGTWVSVDGEWGKVIGPDKSHVRISDKAPDRFLDISRIDDTAAYANIGGNRITAVFRKSVPFDSGIYRSSDGGTRTGSSLKHYVYLQLERALDEGSHIIRWPDNALPDTPFHYSKKQTRAIAIRANQVGYHPSDDGKIAYLSLWLPGGPMEGAVDFRVFGLKTFHILDDKGDIQFTSDIKLRIGPSDPEPGNGLRAPLIDYPSLTQPKVSIGRLTFGTPITISAPQNKLSNGQRIWLDGFSGSMKHMNGFATVATASPDSFTIAEGPAGNSAPASSSNPLAWRLHKANRAGTHVFELDFGAWRPTADGTYRIYVPGLGMSDKFEVRKDIWLIAGRASIGGLYNHRSGIELDGRFGYSRPASFRPGQNVTVRKSRLPLAWTSNTTTGFISAGDGANSTWLTDETAPLDYWGGYMDAGDWDRLIIHVQISVLLLDVYESAPALMQSVSLNIPKSGEALDPTLYAGTDDLPDIVHEAIWTMDFFRRLQSADGGISGGIESAGHPRLGEPSFLEGLAVYSYAPDHITSYRYSAAAAKLSGVLKGLGKEALATVYRNSALDAWHFSERVMKDPDTYYAEPRAIATKAGAFANVPWPAQAEKLQKAASEFRTAAAASLFRLTGNDDFRSIFEAAWTEGGTLFEQTADGAWDYYNATHAGTDPELKKRIRQLFLHQARAVAEAQGKVAYASMKHPYAPIGWGQGLAPDFNQTQMFIRAHRLSQDAPLLRTMQVASAHILGANQVGLSFTTGLGVRNVKHPLHEDHRALGIKVPDGITLYGWASQADTAHEWIFGPPWSPMPVSGTDDNARYRAIAPNRFSMPFYEYLIEHPLVVMQQEYTVHQTIGTTAAMWLYLHSVAAQGQNAAVQ